MSPKSKIQRPQSKVQSPKSKVRSSTGSSRKLPLVFVNMVMTADGKTAFTNRRFIPFASRRDQEHLLALRATADAVMCGARTVDSSPVILGTGGAKYRRKRLQRGLGEHHLRVVVSGSGSVDPRAEIFKRKFSPIVVLTTRRVQKRRWQQLRRLAEVKICGRKEINFRAALRWLREQKGVKRLLCEGGSELNDALLRAGLVDELHLTISPKLFGGRTAPTIADGAGFSRLANAARLELISARRVGDELFLVYRTRRGNPKSSPATV
jgi:riboflavin-specific deaminase-like protein